MIIRLVIAAVLAAVVAGGALYVNTANAPPAAATQSPAKMLPQGSVAAPVQRAPKATSAAESAAIGNIKIKP